MAEYDEHHLVEDTLEIVIQINGKVRERMMVARDTSQKELEELALANENVRHKLKGKRFVKLSLSLTNSLTSLQIKVIESVS